MYAYQWLLFFVFKKVHTSFNCGQIEAEGEERSTHKTEQLPREDPTGCSNQENHCDLTEQ